MTKVNAKMGALTLCLLAISLAVQAAPGGSGIVYTCDSTISALSATACTTLNTTIAGLYKTAFANANASIYVQLGNGPESTSSFALGRFTYSVFRNALIAAAPDPDRTIAIASLPAANPLGSNSVGITTALQRALGLSATPCLGTSGCYDGTVTITNSIPLYFRTGSISNNQYDFFTLVEHETDEILGTASCALGCGISGIVYPTDYFRYHSDGTRSLAAGTNNPCASSDSTNACFSLDGIHMLRQYDNANDGGDPGDWLTNCHSPLVQDVATCNGNAGVDIFPTAEIILLDVIGYSLRTPPLQIISAANASIVWIAPGSLASAYGADLATSLFGTTPLPLPTSFGGTSVSIRDASGATLPAPLLYVSPTQVNFEVPPAAAIGAAQATITSGDGIQSVANVEIASVAPGLFQFNTAGLAAAYVVLFHPNQTQTVEQVYTTNGTGAIVANPVSVGSAADQAYLSLFGTGLQAAGTAGVTASIGGTGLTVQYAGPQGGYAGLDQVNVLLPAALAGTGNITIQVTVNRFDANPVNITIQ